MLLCRDQQYIYEDSWLILKVWSVHF
jgi:hypothetical protein